MKASQPVKLSPSSAGSAASSPASADDASTPPFASLFFDRSAVSLRTCRRGAADSYRRPASSPTVTRPPHSNSAIARPCHPAGWLALPAAQRAAAERPTSDAHRTASRTPVAQKCASRHSVRVAAAPKPVHTLPAGQKDSRLADPCAQ